jgi:predicted dehydrogenase
VVACDRTELISVADAVGEKAEAIRERYQAATCYTDYREMIDRESPDIVCIATRPATHSEMTVYASEHGVKGIYCEKPLCGSMAEADAMVDAVERNGVRFNYGTQRRYVPLYQEIRKRVDSGELGSIDCVIVQQGTSAALWGLTHGSDLMLYLAGDPEVEFVQGTILCEEDDWEGRRLNADPGIAAGYVRFANGIHGYFTAGRGAEFEVCGAEGKIRTFDNGLSWRLRKQSRGGQAMEDASIPDIPLESGTVSGILDIAEAIDSGRETRGPVQLARRSQEMLMAIIESHRLGGIRIPLPMASRDLYVGREGW